MRQMARGWNSFREHFPLLAALMVGLAVVALVLILRGMVGISMYIEWPLLVLLLVGINRSVASRVLMLTPTALVLAFLDGVGPGVYLAGIAGGVLAGFIPSRGTTPTTDPVTRGLQAGWMVAGWMVTRLLLGAGFGVIYTSLLTMFVALLACLAGWGLTILMTLWNGPNRPAPSVTLGPRGAW